MSKTSLKYFKMLPSSVYYFAKRYVWTTHWISRLGRIIIFGVSAGISLLYVFQNFDLLFPKWPEWIRNMICSLNEHGTFHLLFLSIPVATGVWIYRNNDKIQDQKDKKQDLDNFEITRLEKEYQSIFNEFEKLLLSSLRPENHNEGDQLPDIEYLLKMRGLDFKVSDHTGEFFLFQDTSAYKKLKNYFQEMSRIGGLIYNINPKISPSRLAFNKYQEVVRYFAEPLLEQDDAKAKHEKGLGGTPYKDVIF